MLMVTLGDFRRDQQGNLSVCKQKSDLIGRRDTTRYP